VENLEQLEGLLEKNERNVKLFRENNEEAWKKKCAYCCFTAAEFSRGYSAKQKKWYEKYRSEASVAYTAPFITLDLDHCDGNEEWQRVSKIVMGKYGSLEESPLAWAFLSPSRALKMVFRVEEYNNVKEEQLRLYDWLEVKDEHRDLSTFNLSRATFLTGRDDTLFINADRLFAEYEPRAVVKTVGNSDGDDVFMQDPEIDGAVLRQMQGEWLSGMGYADECVPVGKRHHVSLLMYIDFAHLFGFDSQKMVDGLKLVAENREEAVAIAEWACKKMGNDPCGRCSRLMERLKKSRNLSLTGNQICAEPDLPEHLPENMELLLKQTPREYWKQAAAALLPMLGTLACGARSRYIDGRVQSPTFLVGIIGEQSSNKSYIADLDKVVMEPLRIEDALSRKEMQKRREERAALEKSQVRPKEYDGVIRIISASRSLAALQKMMENAEGLHLYCFASELDTMNRAQKGGPWADMSDFLRNAFDNDEFGNDYKNDESSALRPRAFYNQLTLGTPDSYVEFFRGNITNGLGTRFLLPRMRVEYAADFPQHDHWTEDERGRVQELLQMMMEEGKGEEHDYELPKTTEVVRAFCSEMRQTLTKAGRNSETLCINEDFKRCAVMAFRAGLVAYLLNEKVEDSSVTDFVWFIARYALSCHWDFLGEAEVYSKEHPVTFLSVSGSCRSDRMLSCLPGEFTTDDVLMERFLSDLPTDNIANLLRRLEKSGKIRRSGKDCWIKCSDVKL